MSDHVTDQLLIVLSIFTILVVAGNFVLLTTLLRRVHEWVNVTTELIKLESAAAKGCQCGCGKPPFVPEVKQDWEKPAEKPTLAAVPTKKATPRKRATKKVAEKPTETP